MNIERLPAPAGIKAFSVNPRTQILDQTKRQKNQSDTVLTFSTKQAAELVPGTNNWNQLSVYFKYPPEIRKIIYTTNSIENFNRQLRKVTKSKAVFPTDDALFKSLYLAMQDATKKWTGKPQNWSLALQQLCVYFGDRITPEDLM